MSTFTSDYGHMLTSGYEDTPDPGVERSEVERGVAIERTLGRRVLSAVKATVYFETFDQQQAFMDWYLNDLNRIGWFNWFNPVTRKTTQARFVAGDIGTLSPITNGFALSSRVVSLEYYL